MRVSLLILLLSACFSCTSPEETKSEKMEGSSGELMVDVTESAGIDFVHFTGAFGEKYFPEMAGGGGGFFDYNSDGWTDVLLLNGTSWSNSPGSTPTLELYENVQNGSFKKVTESAGLDRSFYGMGMTAADYDNDGDQDLFLTAVGQNLFFENEGGVFTDKTELAGLVDTSWSTAALFFDYDKDGWLDLLVANYVEWTENTDLFCSLDGENKAYCTPEIYTGVPSKLFRNKGDGTFEDVTKSSNIYNETGKSLGASILDFNEDGWLDLVVANDTQPDLLFRNNGDGTFEEIGLLSGIALDPTGKARAGMGIDVGVVDDTGEETIFVGNFANEMIGVYRDIGNGSFLDRAAVSRIGQPSLLYVTFGLFLFDYDLDFDLDLFAANGHVQPEVEDIQQAVTFKQQSLLFENNYDGTFKEVAALQGSALSRPVVGRGAAYADYDQDGDLDILLIIAGDRPVLLENHQSEPATRAVRVSVRGVTSNKDGIGSRVIAIAGDQKMYQRVKTGSSYLSQSERPLTFGLGTHSQIDSLIVEWPAGGQLVLTDIQPGKHLTITEGTAEVNEAPIKP